ncbi:MAG: hypothetical protein ACREKL_13725 [Chthoniobacterales bacterium]
MSEELSEIQKLIRLKRYEKPREDYFEDFLLEFQRRQRGEMLQRPVWQIAWERANLWLEGFRVPALAYASIVAVALGVAGIMINSPGGANKHSVAAADSSVTLNGVSPIAPAIPVSTDQHSYILEKRPVSYDAPFSF